MHSMRWERIDLQRHGILRRMNALCIPMAMPCGPGDGA